MFFSSKIITDKMIKLAKLSNKVVRKKLNAIEMSQIESSSKEDRFFYKYRHN